MNTILSSEITPEHLYLSRRKFLIGAGAVAATALLSACGVPTTTVAPVAPAAPSATPTDGAAPRASKSTDELGDKLTPYDSITHYNNYYEFSLDKEGPAGLAQGFKTTPWTVQVGGLVNNPKTFGMDDLLKFQQEERIYRLRCVEAWSMVVPWTGFPLSRLLKEVDPLSNAKYVRFETILDPQQMPGQRGGYFHWPYVEGLRMDEAMHDLTILATGLYGKPLPPQDGAPIRLVVPWKYGFKGAKSLVKIDLVEAMPISFWMASAPNEYGFYANVNPDVSHPRWSQATERRIGELSRRKTLLFNGYADQVAHLYDGMDLHKYF